MNSHASDSPNPVDKTDAFPGADLVRQGIEDVNARRSTVEAALTLMARNKLTAAGFTLLEPPFDEPAGHRLYDLLSDEDRATAHSRYNALVGRLTSFLDAVDHASAR